MPNSSNSILALAFMVVGLGDVVPLLRFRQKPCDAEHRNKGIPGLCFLHLKCHSVCPEGTRRVKSGRRLYSGSMVLLPKSGCRPQLGGSVRRVS